MLSYTVCYKWNTNEIFQSNVVTMTDGPSEPSACPEIPTVENADVPPASLQRKYAKGDSLTYNCKQGYVGRVIFVCDGQKWQNSRNSKCSRKSTENIWRISLCI